MDSSDSTRKRRTSLFLAMGVLVVFGLHLREWSFLCDDAYISFRYAANFAESGLPVYNLEPLERVEGYSNPAWVFGLGVLAWWGIAPPTAAPWLCALAGGGSLLLCVGLLRELMRDEQPNGLLEAELYLAPLLLALSPEFVVWGSGGLEGMANLCAGLASLLLAARGRWRGAALAAASCLLLRPDAAFWLGPMMAWMAWRWLRSDEAAESSTRARPLLESLAIVCALVGAHALWRHGFYGEWLPNTWAVKKHGVDLRGTWGTEYLRFWAIEGGFVFLLPALVLLRRESLVWLLGMFGCLGWAWWVGGDFMAYGRFLLPATTFAALFYAASAIVVRRWIAARGGPLGSGLGLSLGVSFCLALLMLWRLPDRVQRDRAEPWIDRKWESVHAMHRFAAVRVAAGEAFASQWPPSTRVTVGAAGAMPYASGLFTFDSYGLVDPGVAEQPGARIEKGARPGHVVYAPLDYMLAREPDLMCHIGHAGPERPSPSSARRRAGRGWSWACVETGPIEDARAPDGEWPSQYYCCLAPKAGKGGGGA